MDNHPIPQDVTGFQFKLVGNMTLKQFGYVATGVILAVVFYYMPLSAFLKYPLALVCALTGITIAFVPIEGRPMDFMAATFVNALIRPNQYIYQKVGGSLSFLEIPTHAIKVGPTTGQSSFQKPTSRASQKQEQLRTFLFDMPEAANNPIDQKESQFLTSLFSPSSKVNPQVLPTSSSLPIRADMPQKPIPSAMQQPPHLQSDEKIDVTNSVLEQSVQPSIQPISAVQTGPAVTPSINLTNQNVNQTQSATPGETQSNPQQISQAAPMFVQVSPTSASVPPAIAPTGLEVPNLITGFVKDSRGNVLSGILVEVKNKDGDSVRAFKTNALGQFASATQLPSGVYTIVFEDTKNQHAFDTVQIEMNGSILPALQIVSIDEREVLRRSLFA